MPISGVTKAPPETPMIIRAEISLSRSGKCCKAYEKIIEKTLEHANPTITTKTDIHNRLFTNNNRIKPTRASIMLYCIKRSEAILANKKAPTNEPMVRAEK